MRHFRFASLYSTLELLLGFHLPFWTVSKPHFIFFVIKVFWMTFLLLCFTQLFCEKANRTPVLWYVQSVLVSLACLLSSEICLWRFDPFFSTYVTTLLEIKFLHFKRKINIVLFGVVKHLLQRIRNQVWRNDQYEKYIFGGKEYNKEFGFLVLF